MTKAADRRSWFPLRQGAGHALDSKRPTARNDAAILPERPPTRPCRSRRALRSAVAELSLNPAAVEGDFNSQEFQIEGRPLAKGQLAPRVEYLVATPEYLDTLGLPLVSGRRFSDQDRDGSVQVGVVNQNMVRHRWPNEDPIGRRVSFDKGEQWITIVGIIANAREFGLDHPVPDEFYVPLEQNNYAGTLLVRTASEPAAMIRQVTRAMHSTGVTVAVDRWG